eukprot:EG_transcript_19540
MPSPWWLAVLWLVCLPPRLAKPTPGTEVVVLAAIRGPSLPTLHMASLSGTTTPATPATHLMPAPTSTDGSQMGSDGDLPVPASELERLQSLLRPPSLPTVYNPQLSQQQAPTSVVSQSDANEQDGQAAALRAAFLRLLGPLLLALLGAAGAAVWLARRGPPKPIGGKRGLPAVASPAVA